MGLKAFQSRTTNVRLAVTFTKLPATALHSTRDSRLKLFCKLTSTWIAFTLAVYYRIVDRESRAQISRNPLLKIRGLSELPCGSRQYRSVCRSSMFSPRTRGWKHTSTHRGCPRSSANWRIWCVNCNMIQRGSTAGEVGVHAFYLPGHPCRRSTRFALLVMLARNVWSTYGSAPALVDRNSFTGKGSWLRNTRYHGQMPRRRVPKLLLFDVYPDGRVGNLNS
ncbi:hypothetical protein B0H14DRAFT_2867879 [Mycena olivaceomarginata]|nr:hypothetical protein B0H14DRAFT_2867879 [Mycena olivaceomarginata]